VHIREFTDALVDAGHDVFIICSWLGESLDIQTKARVYHLQPTGFKQILWESLYADHVIQDQFLDRDIRSILWNAWLQSDGAAIVEHEKPDFLYERYALFGIGGLELSRRFNLPLILELNAPLCDQQEGYQKFPLIQTARQLEPHIICNADATVALTDWLADWAIGLGACREKVHVLPDAVSDVRFKGQISSKRVRDEFGLTDSKVVGFVGSFHKWHDLAGLIEAFSTLSVADPALRLLLVGDGHDRRKCQKQVHQLGLDETVVFAGNVPHCQVPEYLAAMDVSVVPYRHMDDFFFSPMKLFESMAAGCPTIAADLGQISEVVRHQKTGWLYTPGNNVELAEGIARLLDDSPLADRIGAAAREYVLANHTWRHVTSEVVRIAGELLIR
jgi:glycosyltransferase involved in cell wall biosynthesis